ncbi:MAG: transglutaminase domain-containing protein [Lachnospiraceae bacterium]|nr:transglutaminase domain-containing protein [Lachnospiraceae bacterium]
MNYVTKKLISGISSIALLSGSLFYMNNNLFKEVEPLQEELVYVEDQIEVSESEVQIEMPIQPIGLIDITASALNVRETPNGNVRGAVKKDEISYFYGFSGNWLQILYNGQYGFVYSKYTDIYDFTNNKISTSDLQAIFGAKESLATKQLNDSDILILKNYEEIHRNELVTAFITGVINETNEVTPVQATDDAAKALAEQQAAAQAALAAQQQAALAQAEELAKQQAEAQAALLEEQQKALQVALEAQLAAEAKKQELLAKNPATLSTPELCQYVLAQIITPDMDDYAKAVAVNNWLCDHMTYDLNYYTTRDALLIGRGRCQGYANAYKNLMNAAGVPTDFIGGYGNGGRHGWNRVLINGTYYYVDVTWNDSTGNYSRYLLISEAEMNRDHQPRELNPRTE